MMAVLVMVLLIAAFLLLLVVRAAAFRPAQAGASHAPVPCEVDQEAAVDHLAQMVRIPTVSNADPARFDEAQFAAFRALCRSSIPMSLPYADANSSTTPNCCCTGRERAAPRR